MTIKEIFPNKPNETEMKQLRYLAEGGCRGTIGCQNCYIDWCEMHARKLHMQEIKDTHIPNKVAIEILKVYGSCIQK